MKNLSPFILIAVLLWGGCEQAPGPMPASEVVETLQKKLIEAKEGEVIWLPEGEFSFQRPLSINDVPGLTLKGAGKGKTILSFKDQIEGAEGLTVKNARDITLEGFTVADSKGDAVKVQASENVIMRDLEATWTGGALPTNGSYGLYPVNCTNLLMEDCEASYAMDAGIYVGQSTNAVVRNNYAHHNVAGIEIENTIGAEVYENTAQNNTAGMLLFDMPDVPQANGERIRFFKNKMEQNNFRNFSPPGLVVNLLPPGTGILLMAHKKIDVFDNDITGHKTVGVGMVSWLFTGKSFESKEYNPFCEEIYVHDNRITGNVGPTDTTTQFGKLFTALFQGQPKDIVVDGIYKPDQVDENGNPKGLCFRNNGDVSFVNLNAGMGASPEELAQNMDNDQSPFDCSLPEFPVKGLESWKGDEAE